MRLKSLVPAIAVLLAGAMPVTSSAGTYSYDCAMASVTCDGLLNDVVTDKFTDAFNHTKYKIFIYGETVAFSDQTGVSMALVGVIPKVSKSSTHEMRPKRLWRNTSYYPKVGNAYNQQELAKKSIRSAVESMMASCDDSPNCAILGDSN